MYIDLSEYPGVIEQHKEIMENDLAYSRIKRTDLSENMDARQKHSKYMRAIIALDSIKILVGITLVMVLFFK